MRSRPSLLCLMLLLAAACSEQDDENHPSYTPPPCDGVYGSVYSQCEQRALSGECAGAFGFGLLFCIGQVCSPEAHRAVFECCNLAYATQDERAACYDAMAP